MGTVADKDCQIEGCFQQIELKQHQGAMLSIIQTHYPKFDGKVLDIGCSNGMFLGALSTIYPDAHYTGIDISAELIEIARKRVPKANLLVEDAMNYQPSKKFDIIIASGILSIFDDFEPVLDKWISWLADMGRLYIFGRFNSQHIDTKIHFRTDGGWETGLTSYSVYTIANYLAKRGLGQSFRRFYLGVELPQGKDPIRTYTKRCEDGTTLVLNGANTVAEHYFLTILKGPYAK